MTYTPPKVLIPNEAGYEIGLKSLITYLNEFLNSGIRTIVKIEPYF